MAIASTAFMEIPNIEWLPKIENVSVPPALVAASIEELNGVIPRSVWSAIPARRSLFRGVALSSNLKALVLNAGVFPAHEKIVVVDIQEPKVFLPTERMHDLLEVCRQAYDLSLSTVVVFHEFCVQNYGLVIKKTAPVRLATSSDLAAVGLDPVTTPLPTAVDQSLWWQRWGGNLYLVTFTSYRNCQSFLLQTTHSYVGNCERLPSRMLR
jgi:hypothetical protein